MYTRVQRIITFIEKIETACPKFAAENYEEVTAKVDVM
jgi:hypothetical protein